MREAFQKNPKLKGLIMRQNGLISWTKDDKECYELSLDITEKTADYSEAHDRGDDTFWGQKYSSLSNDKREALLTEILPNCED